MPAISKHACRSGTRYCDIRFASKSRGAMGEQTFSWLSPCSNIARHSVLPKGDGLEWTQHRSSEKEQI